MLARTMTPSRNPVPTAFAIVPDCHAATGYYRTLWERHFYAGLRGAVGRLVVPRDVDFSWARALPMTPPAERARRRAATSQRLGEEIRQARQAFGVDLVVSYCFSDDLELGLVKETMGLGVPWVNFYCDSTHRFREVAELARVVSLNWFPEHAAIPSYRGVGAKIACRPYAVNPDFLPNLQCSSAVHPVGFVGLPTANRITQLGLLRLLGCPVVIRGKGWGDGGSSPFYSAESRTRRVLRAIRKPDLGEKCLRRVLWPLVRPQAGAALTDVEFEQFVRQCGVVLGLNQGRDEHGRLQSYLKFRDVEFPGYGCCYLTEQNDDIAHVFEPGKEVLTYASLPEAARRLRHLAGHGDEAARVGAAGRRRALATHTWARRLDELICDL